jgi:hypothetical protein
VTPCIPEQIDAQEALFPSSDAVPFGPAEALAAADFRNIPNLKLLQFPEQPALR